MIDTYVSVDLETTGLNPKYDKIIEIGAVKVIHGEMTETFESFVNPHRKLDKKVIELTHITDEQLVDAPEIEIVLKQFLEFAGEEILLGHRILFDYSFLKKAAVNCKLPFERRGIDTLKLARKYLPDLESRRLPFLCQYYGIAYTAHRALEDAKASHLLYQRLMTDFCKEEEFKAYPLIYQVKKEAPASKHQKERLCQLIDKHKLIVDYDVDSLTKNEVSRYTDKILAKYGR
ncbi:MAG: 3'-5' exonuclease [Lachnospiraceae bacterium]|nr:3'-5' exonuclease [Lachnospiraceae bacterium]